MIPAPDAPGAPENAAEITLTLSSLSIEGSTVFSPEELAPLYRDKIGTTVSLLDIYAIAAAITEKYGERGYALCIAFLPAQRISNGSVRIQIVEGYVESIEHAEGSDPIPTVAETYLDSLKQSKPLKSRDLERALLLANDVPGLKLRGTFDKGKEGTGATKLIVDAQQDYVSGAAQASNRGSEAVGRYLAQASISANSILGTGEQLSLDMVQSLQWNELHFLSGRASVPLDDLGTRLSGSLSYSESDPGTSDLDALNFVSNGWTGTLEVSHPLIRSRKINVFLRGGVNGKLLDSDLLGTTNSSDRLYVAFFGGTYGWSDKTAFVQLSADARFGLDIFDATTDLSPERSRASGSGDFTSLSIRADLSHRPARGIALRASAEGQIASRGLLASEECGYGGELFGRAFDGSEIVGEHCVKGMIEAQAAPFIAAELPDALGDVSRTLTLHVFYDAGIVFQEGQIFPGEERRESSQSFGGGLRVSPIPQLSATIEYAVPLGRDVALEGDRDGRLFFSIASEW